MVCNEFLMKSNLTFHSAALEYIRTKMVSYLAFVIFFLEKDGIINCNQNPLLFSMAKENFQKIFCENYIHSKKT